MFPEEARQIYMHLTEVLRQLESVRADYPEEGWALSHLHEDIRIARNRINDMLGEFELVYRPAS
jgi:hypothetical protein